MSSKQEKKRDKDKKAIAEEFRQKKKGTSKAKHNHVHFRHEINERLTNKSLGNRGRRSG